MVHYTNLSKMRKDGNSILITLDEWTSAGLSFELYKSDKKRGYLQSSNRASFGNGVEIIWQSIVKEARKQAIIARHGKPEDICSVATFSAKVETDAKAQQFYNDYLLPDGRHLSPERIAEYTANVEVLTAVICGMNDRKGTKRALGGRVAGILASLTDAANRLDRVQFPHTLPSNERRMRDVIARYRAEGYAAFIHKNFTNKHAAKVDDEVKESLMIELISDPRNVDNEQVRALYNVVAEVMGWKKITAAAVAVWREKLDLVSYAGRRGETAFRNTRTMQVKRKAPSFPTYYWTSDGWDVELLYQATKTDKNGHTVTTYHNRLTVVVVLDACGKYPIGYAIGDHETPELIAKAFRNATNHTIELFGSRHRSHQVQSDRYAIKTLKPLYTLMGEKHTPARVGNAKSKVIEPYFLRLNKKYCQLMPNWSGFGLTSDKDNQPNVDYINKHKKLFPDREGCEAQIRRIIEMERAAKRDKFIAKWAEIPANDQLAMPTADYLFYFGETTGEKNLLEGSGINVTIQGLKQHYDCFDLNFREHYGVRWTVLYDPDDLSQAMAVNDEGTLRFMLESKYIQPMALRDRKDGDADELTRIFQYNRSLESSVTERRRISGDHTRQLFAENPQLNDTLTKMLLVDSRGQHKDERNALRVTSKALPAADIEPIEDEAELVLVPLNNEPLEDNEETNIYDLY